MLQTEEQIDDLITKFAETISHGYHEAGDALKKLSELKNLRQEEETPVSQNDLRQ